MKSLAKLLCYTILLWGVLVVFNDGKELWLENADSFYANNRGFFADKHTHYSVYCGQKKCAELNFDQVKYIIRKDNHVEGE